MQGLNAQQLWFSKPYAVEVREQTLSPPQAGQCLVKASYSAISAGTEMLVYRGQVPDTLALDASLSALGTDSIRYPLQYGYASVGVVDALGDGVDPAWLGQAVFAFQPHASHYLAKPEELIRLPDGINLRDAVFLANSETAVNLVLDAHPRIGERVLVLGLGVVGLLTASALVNFPLSWLAAVDAMDRRREMAQQLGVTVFDPRQEQNMAALQQHLQAGDASDGADLVLELSGNPAALNLAIELCGYGGRIVVGSWYGNKPVELDLGGRFHRNRISIVSSQVSSLAPELSGRWTKARRFAVAWEQIKKCQPAQFITHSMPLREAAQAYQLLDSNPEQAMQIIFDYQS
jgi:2-desacetyl-2-hydroxyethyl bacteriochlorophyllide A dehydrogenase